MMRSPAPALASLLLAALAGAAAAQRVALPNDTGALAPGAAWTVLREHDLQADARPGDPDAEPARTRLFAVIAELKNRGRTARNVLLHQPGDGEGSLRLVNAYSADVRAAVDDLLDERAVTEMRSALLDALGEGTEFVAHERTDVFATGGLLLRFTTRVTDARWLLDLYVAPAGDRLQYFEATYRDGDAGARPAVEALLATFDGAREAGGFGSGGVVLGGIVGAIAGMLAGMLRRRSQLRKLTAAGEGAAPADGGERGGSPPTSRS